MPCKATPTANPGASVRSYGAKSSSSAVGSTVAVKLTTKCPSKYLRQVHTHCARLDIQDGSGDQIHSSIEDAPLVERVIDVGIYGPRVVLHADMGIGSGVGRQILPRTRQLTAPG